MKTYKSGTFRINTDGTIESVNVNKTRESVAITPTDVNKKEWTGFQLYCREHPTWSKSRQFMGFVILTLAVMVAVLGGLWTIQHLDTLIAPAVLILSLAAIRRLK